MAKTTVSAGYIAANAITSTELAANSVTAASIAAGAILSVDVGANSVTSTAIAANAVSSSEVASNAISTAQIASNAVTAASIATNAVGADQISPNAVESSEIASNAVGTAQIAGNSVGISELNVSDGTNGQYLQTNGSGTLSFSTVSGYTDSDVETYLNTSEIYTDPTNNYLGVGAGASTPSHVFHVQKSVASGTLVKLQNASNTASDVLLLTTAGTGSGTNILDVQASGSSKFLVRGDGNVGIGTSSPDEALHVYDTTESWIKTDSSTADGNSGLRFAHAGTNHGVLYHDGSTDNLNYYDNIASATRFTIDSSGYVGIGTTSPSSMLHLSAGVTGVSGGEAASLTLTNKFDTPDNSWTLKPQRTGVSNTGLEIRDVTDSRSDMSFDGAGNVGVGTASPYTRLHVLTSGSSGYTAGANRGITITDSVGPRLILEDTGATSGYRNFFVRNEGDLGILGFLSDGGNAFTKDQVISIHGSGSVGINCSAGAGKSFEVQDKQSGYSSFWVDDNNRQYGRGITNAMGLLGGTSTQYDGDGAYFPLYGFGAAADNAATENLTFWVKASTGEWQPMVFFCIGASCTTSISSHTAGWALIRASYYNGSLSASILDSGGGGTFTISAGGSMDAYDVMTVTLGYSLAGATRTTLSAWGNTYQSFRGAQRA